MSCILETQTDAMGQLSKVQVAKAVSALTKWLGDEKSKAEKESLFEDDELFYLVRPTSVLLAAGGRPCSCKYSIE